MTPSKMNKLILILLVIQPSMHNGTYIHVHPDFVFLADVCNSYERIKCPIHCCPSCGTHQKRNKSLQESRRTLCMVRVLQSPHPSTPLCAAPTRISQRTSLLCYTHLDTSNISVSALRWQQTSKPVSSICYDARDR